ncbi:MAG TPA: hypothetical protein VEA44_16755 [Caulobacter sp.]|nr:hypothetical protein [Caulobacter sp.]
MTQENIGEQNINPKTSARDLARLAEREEEEGVVDQQTVSAPVDRGGTDEAREGGGKAAEGAPPAAGEFRGPAGDPAEGRR